VNPPGGSPGAEREWQGPAPAPAQSEPASARARNRAMLLEYGRTRDPALRDRLVEANANLVHFIARRFANRGEPLEDIEQVGFLGLIHAIERFDPGLENEFSTFATPTIMGEIRRYFRDRSWAVRVPRRLQENFLRVNRARQEMSATLGREPSISEIAERLELEPDDVLAALEVAPAQHALSLESRPSSDPEEGAELGERLGQSDENLELVETHDLLEKAMAHLTAREKQIVALRFIDQLPQTEVAERLGISQMHVSRLQRAALDHMRRDLEAAGAQDMA
jgi:RNA polymerase sigma-B factor